MPTPALPPILTLGNPRLAQASEPVPESTLHDPAFRQRLSLLRDALDVHGANGVAAPQLGWFERVFVMRDPSGGGEVITWINPEIVSAAEELVWYWEGCLSVPGYKAWVGRSAAIAVNGLDGDGNALSREFADWESHLFQHEFDHLDGILFPYRVADPRHMVTAGDLEHRADWPPDWPAPGARDTPVRVMEDGAAEST